MASFTELSYQSEQPPLLEGELRHGARRKSLGLCPEGPNIQPVATTFLAPKMVFHEFDNKEISGSEWHHFVTYKCPTRPSLYYPCSPEASASASPARALASSSRRDWNRDLLLTDMLKSSASVRTYKKRGEVKGVQAGYVRGRRARVGQGGRERYEGSRRGGTRV